MANIIFAAFYNGSSYDHHFIIKELANESEGHFECLEENTEKKELQKSLRMAMKVL